MRQENTTQDEPEFSYGDLHASYGGRRKGRTRTGSTTYRRKGIFEGLDKVDGKDASWKKFRKFLHGPARLAIATWWVEPPPGVAVRVLAVRHAMGEHNRFSQLGSIHNRDAELTEVGEAQAAAVGRLLEEENVLQEHANRWLTLVVACARG